MYCGNITIFTILLSIGFYNFVFAANVPANSGSTPQDTKNTGKWYILAVITLQNELPPILDFSSKQCPMIHLKQNHRQTVGAFTYLDTETSRSISLFFSGIWSTSGIISAQKEYYPIVMEPSVDNNYMVALKFEEKFYHVVLSRDKCLSKHLLNKYASSACLFKTIHSCSDNYEQLSVMETFMNNNIPIED